MALTYVRIDAPHLGACDLSISHSDLYIIRPVIDSWFRLDREDEIGLDYSLYIKGGRFYPQGTGTNEVRIGGVTLL